MPETVPCLWFDTEAEQAAAHYVSIFPNSSVGTITHYPEDSPAGTGGPSAGAVLTVDFTLDGRPYTALNGGPQFPFTEAVSLQVLCRDQAEIDHYWERLGEGGEESVCGWLKDRYGLSWQIVPAEWMSMLKGDPARAARGFRAIMGMKKIILADVLRAADAD
jgi:predicted 3-demethylubiquinone-9 3-methyltransferase (glyoxalase superfamily)